MYETTSTFLKSELDYRATRIKSSAAGARRPRRVHRVRRPAEATNAR